MAEKKKGYESLPSWSWVTGLCIALPSIADVITIGPRALFSLLLPYKLYTAILFDLSSMTFTPASRRIQFGLPSQSPRRIS